jgi:hypothetical protein
MDSEYHRALAEILRELVQLVGPIDYGAPLLYPLLARGQGWRVKFGVPRDQQQHYVEFDSDEMAVFYLLRYGGDLVE